MTNKQNNSIQTDATVSFNESITEQIFLHPFNKPNTSQEKILTFNENKIVKDFRSSFMNVEDSGNDTENEIIKKRFMDIKTSM